MTGTIAYGPHPDQVADLRVPTGTGPFPVAVLIHGGYWRSRYAYDLMDALALDLTAHGMITWNVEYRRPDAHGWDATTADIAAALAAAADLPGAAPRRVTVIGHSAGGQLALRAAADRPASVALAVSLAGVLDLHTGHALHLSGGAVAAALGGTPEEIPDVYAVSSPTARLPLGTPQLIVCGTDDELLPLSRSHAEVARAAGDPCELLVGEGDHFAVIDPRSALWAATRSRLPGEPAPP